MTEIKHDKISRSDLQPLTIHELRNLLNKQIGEKRRMADKMNECKAAIGTYTTNIHNIRARINALSPADTPLQISDHAILRYLERIVGVNLADATNAIDTPELRESTKHCPTGRHTINGITYVMQEGAVVTIMYDESHPLHSLQKRPA